MAWFKCGNSKTKSKKYLFKDGVFSNGLTNDIVGHLRGNNGADADSSLVVEVDKTIKAYHTLQGSLYTQLMFNHMNLSEHESVHAIVKSNIDYLAMEYTDTEMLNETTHYQQHNGRVTVNFYNEDSGTNGEYETLKTMHLILPISMLSDATNGFICFKKAGMFNIEIVEIWVE